MEIVWQSGETTPRKRTPAACTACRSRKKRCYHSGDHQSERGKRLNRTRPQRKTSSSNNTTRRSSPSPGRVSEYNPGSVLAALSENTESGSNGQLPESHHISSQLTRQASTPSPSVASEAHRRLIWYKQHKNRVALPNLSEAHRNYLEDEGAFITLPRSTTDALLPLYTSILDDLTPIVNGTSVFRDHSNGYASSYLVKAICLVVCKAKQAAPFLSLTDSGPVLEPLEFASKLLAGLDAAIKADLEPDRVAKIQILALMHLHNDGLGGVDRASSYLSQAICEAWSMCIHLKTPGNPDKEICEYLWWSLRNFDRIGKPVMAAAPFFIDDADIGIERIKPQEASYRSQLMAVALNLGDLMKMATKAYKAASTSVVDGCREFPSLSEITSGSGFEQFHMSHRAYLEIWYHVASMLSCRYSGPNTIQYNRRLASADRVLEIVSNEGIDRLPPLPLIPYAMSMATTVIYRALHDGERNVNEASSDLRQCCDALDVLSQQWTSVRGVTKLANRLRRLISSGELNCSGPASMLETAASTGDCFTRLPTQRDHITSSPQATDCTPAFHHTITAPPETRLAYSNETFQRQLTEVWPGIDASYSQIDWTFQDYCFDLEFPTAFNELPF